MNRIGLNNIFGHSTNRVDTLRGEHVPFEFFSPKRCLLISRQTDFYWAFLRFINYAVKPEGKNTTILLIVIPAQCLLIVAIQCSMNQE